MTIEQAVEIISDKEPLFTNLVKRLKPIKDPHCPTLGTDGKTLRYNPDYLESLTDGEVCAVMLHEVLHCAFAHQWRRGERDPMKWNIACDFAINIVVNEHFALPKGTLLDMQYVGMSASEIYDALPEGESSQSWCEKDGWGEEKKGEGSPKKMSPKQQEKSRQKEREQYETEQAWRELLEKDLLKQYGKLSESVKRLVEETYYKPVIDWSELASHLLTDDVTDYSFSSPDRRFMDSDFILPDLHSLDRLKDVVFAYDTSGSIEEHDLNSFYLETVSLFNNFSSLQGWVAVCDSELQTFKEISPQQGFDDFEFTGGGGTSFIPVFEEIKNRGIRPKAVFYFTDMAGDYPDEKPDYPVFWLTNSRDSYWRTEAPFGEVIEYAGKWGDD